MRSETAIWLFLLSFSVTKRVAAMSLRAAGEVAEEKEDLLARQFGILRSC